MSKETKIKSKGNWGLAKALTAGLIIGGAVGTGAYFVYTNIVSDKSRTFIKYAKPIEKKLMNEVPLQIRETNPGAKEEDREYFLSDKGMDLLKERIENDLNFGPEFFDLHSITIDDQNSIGPDANGNYYPQRDTINLSSGQFRKEGLPALKKGASETSGYEEVKVELLFQVLFHEYGHFIANKYLNVYSDANSILTKGVNGKTPWDPDFQSNFESIMGYDSKTAKPKLKLVAGQAWQSMGAIYSSADIFQRINYGDQKFTEMDSDDWVPVWAGENPFFKVSSTYKGVAGNKLGYLWSMDEIYTRKYQQVLYPVKTEDLGVQENFISSGGFHYYIDTDGNQTNNITTYTYDTSLYRDIGKTQNDYMEDNPLKHSNELKSLMNRHEGRGDEISVILYDRNGDFRIGGYTTDKSFTINIGGRDITSTIDEIPYLEEKKTDKKLMWISQPIKQNDVLGILHKPINKVTFDADNNKILTPITSVRHGNDGMITTHRQVIPHSNDYHMVYDVDSTGKGSAHLEKGAGK